MIRHLRVGLDTLPGAALPAVLQERLGAAGAEAEALRAEAARKAPGAGKLRQAMAERGRKMGALLQRIHDIEDRIFAAFSEKVPAPH